MSSNLLPQEHYDAIAQGPPFHNVLRNHNGVGRHTFLADGGAHWYEISKDGKQWKAIAPDNHELTGAKTMSAAKALAEYDAHGRYHKKQFPHLYKQEN